MELSILPLGALQTNCYILSDEQTKICAVIDPAEQGEQLAATLKSMGLTLQYILLTHGHYDHVGGVSALHEATGAPVYLNEKELTLPESITAGKLFYTNFYSEGDTLAFGGITLRVMETPGHTPGSVCLLAGDMLFAGDTLFAGSCGRVDFAGGSMEQMLSSLARLAALEGDYTVYPGHGGETMLSTERKYNSYMREAQR